MVALSKPLPEPSVAPAPAAAQAPGPFIVSPRYDAFFFFASALAVVLAYVASHFFHVDGFYVLAAVAVVSNGPHLTSTWTRVYFDKREWRLRPLHIFLMPALITAAVVGLTLQGSLGDQVLTSALLYWATWHFLAQNWGLLRIYQRRSGEPEGALAMKLERPLMYLAVSWCMLHRLETGPRAMFGVEVAHYPLPMPLINAVGAVAALMAVVYLALRVRDLGQPWAKSAWIRAGFLFCAFLGFFVPFIMITEDGTTAFAAAACWHGFQYLGIIRFYHRNAWRSGIHPDSKVMSWLSQPGWGRVALYMGLLWGLAGAGYVVIFALSLFTRNNPAWTIETWGGVVWMSFTFSHYYLDGVIWKLRKDQTMASRLLVS